jgi:uncharacterized protein YpmB
MTLIDKYQIVILILLSIVLCSIGFGITRFSTSTKEYTPVDSETIMIIYKRGYLEGAINGIENNGLNRYEFKQDSSEVKKSVDKLFN